MKASRTVIKSLLKMPQTHEGAGSEFTSGVRFFGVIRHTRMKTTRDSDKGKSKGDFSRSLGVSPSEIKWWRRGESNPCFPIRGPRMSYDV